MTTTAPTPPPDPRRDAEFDRRARQWYAQSLAQLSPATRLRLRPGTATPPARAWRFAWPLAAACAVGALAIGLQRPPAPATSAPQAQPVATLPPAENEPLDTAVLDESPDLYLWLASTDAGDLTLE